MAVLTKGTWVLIADGEKALFTRNLTNAENPNLEVVRKESQDNPPNREQSDDRPGRLADIGPGQRSAVEETDWHKLAKERFAEDLATRLYEMAHRGAFDRIVLVAAPDTLGALRRGLHKEVSGKVVGEVAKNLTGHPLPEIEKILVKELER